MQHESLRFDPSELPALTATLTDAIYKLDANLNLLQDHGRLPEPWLGDEVSAQVAARYHDVAFDGEDNALGVLRQYQRHLEEVVEQLNATASAYAQSDASNAASLRPPG